MLRYKLLETGCFIIPVCQMVGCRRKTTVLDNGSQAKLKGKSTSCSPIERTMALEKDAACF